MYLFIYLHVCLYSLDAYPQSKRATVLTISGKSIYICLCMYIYILRFYVCMHLCIYIYIYIYIYIFMYLYVYICIHILYYLQSKRATVLAISGEILFIYIHIVRVDRIYRGARAVFCTSPPVSFVLPPPLYLFL